MKRWYVLYTKPNSEYQAAAALHKRGLQIYLPEFETSSGSQGRTKKKKPFFPCYLFAKIDFTIMGISSVQWTPGLRQIVVFDGQPVPLPDEVINFIQCKLSEFEANGDLPFHAFKPGDTVRITDGPLQDMLAVFDGPTTPGKRVQVLLNILGHASRLYIPVANLEKASPNAETPALKRPRRTRGRGRQINIPSRQAS